MVWSLMLNLVRIHYMQGSISRILFTKKYILKLSKRFRYINVRVKLIKVNVKIRNGSLKGSNQLVSLRITQIAHFRKMLYINKTSR